MKVFIGIDPGLTGAVAAISDAGDVILVADTPTMALVKKRSGKDPKTGEKRKDGTKHVYVDQAMAATLRSVIIPENEIVIVALEAGRGRPEQNSAAVYNTGLGVGLWRGIVAALGLPVQFIEPGVWKRFFNLHGGDKNKAESIVRALQLIPAAAPWLKLKKHEGRAEALLLAQYTKQKHGAMFSDPATTDGQQRDLSKHMLF